MQATAKRRTAREAKKKRAAVTLSIVPAGLETQVPGPQAARAVGLRYVSDTKPGIRRKRVGRAFTYIGKDGQTIRDPETLRRIKSLAIPPAWTDVWICPLANGHVQATGRDARGRKQYRYHPRWHAVRDETKYFRMLAFSDALPRLREKVSEHLSLPGLPREKVMATAVRLLETTLIRVGNEEYARQNQSFGLTTLQNEHVDVSGSTMRFTFRGKGGKDWCVSVRDPRLARVVKRCQELPGQELFEYPAEDGTLHSVTSADVNDYLHEIAGEEFTAKDFRTWAGTVLAFRALRDLPSCETATEAKHNVVEVVKQVAGRLGNTPAICRKCYIHPAVLETYLDPDRRPLLYEDADEVQPGVSADEVAAREFLRRLAREELLQKAA